MISANPTWNILLIYNPEKIILYKKKNDIKAGFSNSTGYYPIGYSWFDPKKLGFPSRVKTQPANGV